MQVFKSPHIETIISDYFFKETRYRVVSPCIYFSLSDGKVQKPEECLEKILALYPNTIIDEGLPKIHGEWQIVGDIYRTANKDHTLVQIKIGNSKKSVLADFTGMNVNTMDLQDPKFKKYLYTYEEHFAGLNKNLRSDFLNLSMDDPRRMKFWGTKKTPQIGAFPDNFSYEYCSSAPYDQRISGAWNGDEEYELIGVVPTEFDGYFHGTLPTTQVLVLGVFYDQKEGKTANLNLDTIKLYPKCNVGIMIWRGLFEIESAKDIDLMMIINRQDYMRQDGSYETNDQYFLEMGIDILKPKDPAQAPIHKIKEKIKAIKKKSRKTIITRYCDVYNEYYNFEYTFRALPRLDPQTSTILTDEQMKEIKGNIDLARDTFQKNGIDWQEVSKVNPDLDRIAKREALSYERNFDRQVSGIIFEKKNFVNDTCFTSLMKPRDLTNYSKNRFMLGFIDKNITAKREEWGEDNPGYFDIPKGIIVPEFFDQTFTSAYVFPNGLYDDQNYYVIPGSEITSYPSWHNTNSKIFCSYFIVDNVLDGLLLNEESYHYLNIAVVPDPSSEIPEPTKKLISKVDFVMIASPSDKLNEVYEKWQGFAQRVLVVPLGQNEDGVNYQTLRELLLDDNTCVSDWLQPYYPFAILDPQHLSVLEYSVAFDNLYSKLTGVKPHTFDTLDRGKKIIEEKRKEVLDICNTPSEKALANQKFDEALANLEADSKLSAEEMAVKAANLQKQNIQQNFEKLVLSNNNKITPEDVKVAKQAVDDCLNNFLANNKMAKIHAKQIVEHLEDLKKLASGTEEEIAKRSNMTAKEISYLKQQQIKNLADIYITDRSWVKIDLSEMTFADSVFDGVDFSETNLNFVTFNNCTFNNCTFDHNHMQQLHLLDCAYTDCTLSHSLVELCQWENCQFSFCTMDELKLLRGKVKNLSIESSELNSLEMSKIKLENANFSFSKFKDLLCSNFWLVGTHFSSCEITNPLFKEIHGDKLIFSTSHITTAQFQNVVLDHLQFDKTDLNKMVMNHSLVKNLTMEGCPLQQGDLSSNVFDGAFIRGSDLSYTNFKGLVAKEGTFTSSIIRYADFFHANLLRANFSKSKLGGTSFCEANLFEADFAETALEKNNFDNADLRRTLISFMATKRYI